ncbi:hypothetical protein [Solidesulfovibrio carbinolicus]|uniref:Uncharacterized protein n=1 Tax=Solidesulfovibrio carbinolicus TaxID=296842 RepID=A0A4P6HMC4_9BACT|nr:hypothetical protein [Solidesulfovibrio carbinolicus]QAZ68185.1 hypothetical protein C3Y92_13510 [Solidesulfovibrio carbinolicus]
MIITDKKLFGKGLLLMASFIAVFILIFSPVFPGGVNGLDFSDDLFNKLSKGSSYFIPTVAKSVKAFDGKQVNVEVKMKSPEDVKTSVLLLDKVGAKGEAKGDSIVVTADLGAMLGKVVADSDILYKDETDKLTAAYGMDGKAAMKGWWTLLNAMIKPLQKVKQIEEANAVNMVNQKAIEPAYNFAGIPAESILTKIPTVAGLLIFYVIYTMWYGYAIFDMFGGMGLSMSKSKIKKEA